MGRSANSFTTWVGHALEINTDKVALPEKDLWVAVLCRAVLDACKGPPHLNMKLTCNISHNNYYNYNREAARHFFLEWRIPISGTSVKWPDGILITSNKKFYKFCQEKNNGRKISRSLLIIVKVLNVDRGRPKYRKKHLTGNAYYAAKAAKGPKNFYYQRTWVKKVGRPRIYNRIT